MKEKIIKETKVKELTKDVDDWLHQVNKGKEEANVLARKILVDRNIQSRAIKIYLNAR